MLQFSSIIIAILVILSNLTVIECHTKSDCGVAETAFGMCVPYVMGDEHNVLPKCCAAVRSVKELSTTQAARRDMCECLRRLMAQVGKIDGRRALELPGECGVPTTVIPTSLDFPCYRLA
ncbi:non-specific lipid-transfer protein A-like [Iris pallida]|uniref:Non-specific lipid-transfer protein A-like n=1 Tax=Iris pallida TaxID=29817 RepID=A0AAX6G077_IRIPA|nr:non-specific lipid-transfer protein A-like [Iris pallida]KAJ6821843.1 non-specific lipid-transfer protein A-like [Iris pallida]